MQTGAGLLGFFAVFYGAVQLASFAAQAASGRILQRVGIGQTMSSLPAGVGLASAIALLFPVWQPIVLVRGIDAVLRIAPARRWAHSAYRCCCSRARCTSPASSWAR
jgi:hypothetical protein